MGKILSNNLKWYYFKLIAFVMILTITICSFAILSLTAIGNTATIMHGEDMSLIKIARGIDNDSLIIYSSGKSRNLDISFYNKATGFLAENFEYIPAPISCIILLLLEPDSFK